MTIDDLPGTPLTALHQELGAKLVEFAGHRMPLNFRAGILREHEQVRSAAGLFDISHMGVVRVAGPGAGLAIERLVPGDIAGLPPGALRYTLLTNDAGGIIDDIIVGRAADDEYEIVVNAANATLDLEHLRAALAPALSVRRVPDIALLALQGPAAAVALAPIAPRALDLAFMSATTVSVDGAPCRVCRSGYTGEDGFEITVPAARAEALARHLLAQPGVTPIGLGARDSLRLEAGLCLHGHEIDAGTTPVQAALEFTIAPARRRAGARPGGFPGAQRILDELEHGAARRRVGLLAQGRQPARAGSAVFDAVGTQVGTITSGTFAPSVGRAVAMATVATACAAPGTVLLAEVRDARLPLTVVPLPFVPHRYHRRPRSA